MPREYPPSTPAQKSAQKRNFSIFLLRGLWAQCQLVSPDRASRMRAIVDEELIEMGAEPETARREATLT